MTTQRSLAVWTAVALIVMTTEVVAQNGKNSSQTNTPNGAPFQQIESQFAQMYQRMAALEAHVDAVESSLQSQINSINASVAGFQTWIGSVNDAITALNNRNAANESLITALQTTIGSLQASFVAVQTNLTNVETQLAGYASATSQNSSAIITLQAEATQLNLQAAQLQSLIATHTGQITTLQGQIASTNQFLANMKGATCTVGQAVSGIQAGGSLTCMTPSAGGGAADVQVAQSSLFVAAGLHTVTAICPLTYKVVGGGYAGAAGMTVYGSFPNAATWVVNADYKPAIPTFATITAHARCVK